MLKNNCHSSLPRRALADLSKLCLETIKTQTIPRIEDLMTGKVSVNDMRIQN